jgi:hypothetical protein
VARGRLVVVAKNSDLAKVVERSRELPPADGVFQEDDFIINLLTTVVDFQMSTTAVARALEHFKAQRSEQIRTMAELRLALLGFPDDQAGNSALAQYLWGYNLWTRAHLLRGVVDYFDGLEVRDQQALRAWAINSEFKRDFEGKVKGLGFAVYKSLVMRQGVDTVKPDVHVRRFVEAAVGRRVSDTEVVRLVEDAAQALGLRAAELDWSIWESQRRASRQPRS